MLTLARTCSPMLLILAMLAVTNVSADDKAKNDADAAKFEQMMKQFITPGPQHEQFKRLAGSWTTSTKSWYPNPNEASTSKGKSRFTLLMGGRYLRQDFRNQFDGEPFQGMGILGYDNAKKKYVGIWIDNHGTGIMHSEGSYDKKTKTMTETGVSSSPIGDMKFKMVTEYKEDDKFVFTMYEVKSDGENKMMEITYTRANSGKTPKKKAKKETK